MLNLSELEQFVTFAEQGTLSGAAQTLHISQPTLTRTMKHVEAAFGVPLFRRSKNKIELNETGLQAVQQAKNLLSAAAGAVQQRRCGLCCRFCPPHFRSERFPPGCLRPLPLPGVFSPAAVKSVFFPTRKRIALLPVCLLFGSVCSCAYRRIIHSRNGAV